MDLNQYINNYIEEHGHSRKTFESIIRDFKEALLEHAIGMDGTIDYDDNDYD